LSFKRERKSCKKKEILIFLKLISIKSDIKSTLNKNKKIIKCIKMNKYTSQLNIQKGCFSKKFSNSRKKKNNMRSKKKNKKKISYKKELNMEN
jgi:hypothetical protein